LTHLLLLSLKSTKALGYVVLAGNLYEEFVFVNIYRSLPYIQETKHDN